MLAGGAAIGSAGASPSPELRADAAALVSGSHDPRVARLLPGRRAGEIGYFVVLGVPKSSAPRSALERAGARILREYATIDVFAVSSAPRAVRRVAEVPGVARLAPIEVVEVEAEQEVDQTRATTADVGAPALWNQGITGKGIRVAVLDTGADATHPDLDDLDFRRWSGVLNPRKVVDARSFVGGGCAPLVGATDGHGHGTHVSGIAAGTGEGTPLADDNGRYAGIAPDAELAIGKVLTDAGAGVNSDLLAAMEWAARPVGSTPCAIGAHVVNLSLGSESRPARLNTGSDVDLVSLMLNRLAVRYGTVFVAAAGNSGPFIGSVLEAPGSAAQALSVGASAKDYDVNHDDTLSGDTCSGYQQGANDCSAGAGNQPPSLGAFSSRGPSGDLWLRPDLTAPGYNIVSAQATTGIALAQNDLNGGTRTDPLYATATGTSMAAPATAGTAALLLQAYRDRHGALPSPGLRPRRARPRRAGEHGRQRPARVAVDPVHRPEHERRLLAARSAAPRVLQPRDADHRHAPERRPLPGAERRRRSLRRAARRGSGQAPCRPGTRGAPGRRRHVQRRLRGGPGRGHRAARLPVELADRSDPGGGLADAELRAARRAGCVGLGAARVLGRAPVGRVERSSGGVGEAAGRIDERARGARPDPEAEGRRSVDGARRHVLGRRRRACLERPGPPGAGLRVGRVARPEHRAGQLARAAGEVRLGGDVYGKWDTIWPSAAGSSGTGAGSDWLVYPVELGSRLTEARFRVYDAAAGDETYDLYLYDADYRLLSSTHPFAVPGTVTDVAANDARGPSTAAASQVLTLAAPAAGRYYVAVSRAKVGALLGGSGDFGAFVLTLDEVAS